jgi:hypothetical protein
MTRLPLVATLGLEMGILGERPEDRQHSLREPFNHFVSIGFSFGDRLGGNSQSAAETTDDSTSATASSAISHFWQYSGVFLDTKAGCFQLTID